MSNISSLGHPSLISFRPSQNVLSTFPGNSHCSSSDLIVQRTQPIFHFRFRLGNYWARRIFSILPLLALHSLRWAFLSLQFLWDEPIYVTGISSIDTCFCYSMSTLVFGVWRFYQFGIRKWSRPGCDFTCDASWYFFLFLFTSWEQLGLMLEKII